MPHPLNLTLPIKQDADSQRKLAELRAEFATHVQPLIDKALRGSEIVHFARLVVIDNKYFQVLTEYDGDRQEYTEFFRRELKPVFKTVFELVEGAPPWSELDNPDAFYRFAKTGNIKALGEGSDPEDGYFFAATGNTTVKQLLEKLD